MTNALIAALVYALIPSVVAAIATAGATFWSAGAKLRSALLHFAAGAKVGVLLAFAMTVEDLTFGLALVTILATAATRWQMTATNAGLGLLFVVITVAAAAFLPAHSTVLSTLILAFGSAALLFVVTEQLLVKAHKHPDAPLLAASFFVGFLLLLILDMVG